MSNPAEPKAGTATATLGGLSLGSTAIDRSPISVTGEFTVLLDDIVLAASQLNPSSNGPVLRLALPVDQRVRCDGGSRRIALTRPVECAVSRATQEASATRQTAVAHETTLSP